MRRNIIKMYQIRRPPYGDRRFDGNALSLFTDQIITPEQFFACSSENISGEKRLLYNLLADAIACYLPRLHPRYEILPLSMRRLADETKEWFFKGNVGQISFQYVCDHLGKAPERIRKKLKELWEKTNEYKQIFSFDYKTFPPQYVEDSIRSYQEKTANGVHHTHEICQQFFCYTMRSITEPMMTYLKIGRFFGRGKAYATKIYREFFFSYINGVPELLRIAEDFHILLLNNGERRAA